MNDLKNPNPPKPPSKYLNRTRGMLIKNLEEKDTEIQFLNRRIDFLNEEINKIKAFLVL